MSGFDDSIKGVAGKMWCSHKNYSEWFHNDSAMSELPHILLVVTFILG